MKSMDKVGMHYAASTLALLALCCAGGRALAESPPRFPVQAVWHQDIRSTPLHPQSATMVSTLVGLGGFGNGRMQIDFSLHIVHASASAPLRSIIGHPSDDEYYLPDCEPVGSPMPVPANAAIEGSVGLTCDNDNDDCHLLVVQGDRLYEAYRANAVGNDGLQSQCLVVWKLEQLYPPSNRGEHCTSADAAGFPIAPLLFNADEVYAAMQVADGDLGHAIRFILPNARMASAPPNPGSTRRLPLYVRPASHAGGPSGPEASVPYGSRLRLRADFPVGLYSPAARVILRTMQRFGIVLSDGGTIALTAETDKFTTHTWPELGIDSRVFDLSVPAAVVKVQDFAVIDTGERTIETYDCVRNLLPADPNTLVGSLSRPTSRNGLVMVNLGWQDGTAGMDIYRNGEYRDTVDNAGAYSEKLGGSSRPTYRVCNADSMICSNPVTLLPARWIDPPQPGVQ